MKRTSIPPAIRAGEWRRLDPACIEKGRVELFSRRKKAVELYIEGVQPREIKLRTNIKANELHRLLNRFLSVDENGQFYGELALRPGFHIKPYTRTCPISPKRSEQHGGMSGVLGALLLNHPEIEEFLMGIIRKKGQPFSATQDWQKYLIGKFYEALEWVELAPTKWPYNTKHKGRRTIRKFVRKLVDENMVRFVRAHGDAISNAHLYTGTGHPRLIRPKRPGDIVELDGHYLDAFFVIQVELMPGYFQEIVVRRIWLLTMIDAFSKAVLAFKLVFKSEISAADVRAVIAQACLKTWSPRDVSVVRTPYVPGAGFPSGVVPDWLGTTFSSLWVDSHLSNMASKITTIARQDFGYMHCLGPTQHFESRPSIERLFKEVARQVQMLPSTTGSNPRQGRAIDPETKAVKYHIDMVKFEVAMDVALANYCATPSEGIGFLTPIGVILQCLQGGALMPKIPSFQREKLQADLSTKTVTVRGSVMSGRRPYVQLDRVHYTNSVLNDSAQWIGKQLQVVVDEDDYRAVAAYLSSGECIGHLQAIGWWSEFKHTVATRRKVNSLVSAGELRFLHGTSPVQQISDYFISHGQALEAFKLAREADPEVAAVTRQSEVKIVDPAEDLVMNIEVNDVEFPLPGTASTRR
ncbi:hypothetical protein [Pseudomonas azerbaijanoccidentalis]